MSGLLQRLALQARGAPPNPASGLRPALSWHAQLPLSAPEAVREDVVATPRPGEAPAPGSADARVATRMTRPIELGPDAGPVSSRAAPAPASVVAPAPQRDDRPRHADPQLHPRARSKSEFELPAPLLDEVPVASTPPPISPAIVKPAALVSPDPGRAQATQVHVHIGRIEVIAGTEPAAPKKSRPDARKTLPLSDYLARRRQP